MPDIPATRKGQPDAHIDRDEFAKRMRAQFHDPAFEQADGEIERLVEIAWNAYEDSRKSPRTRAAGPGFADPDYPLALEWLATREAIHAAQARQQDPSSPSRVLLICASPRSDQTCPGEMSKTYRICRLAQEVLGQQGIEVDLLDLSHLTSEYGRKILPCKGCVSTAMPLCHWPCSCYPNHSLGQAGDWMNELYPRFVAAHGLMIVTPVHWYQAPSVLKLLIDRLVCADGGNPDPTTTHGKHPQEAKALEMKGWSYPRHLRGRAFSVIVHGDAAGAENLRRALSDWLADIGLIPAGIQGLLDRYVGYYTPYAESHEYLDRDVDFQAEARNAAQALVNRIATNRAGRVPEPMLPEPRPK
ncbi:MAG: flavodoxin family protein [Proteobacteria bacterium]|nr:flavodoxin family protein [Pseudomonadota bacterium]